MMEINSLYILTVVVGILIIAPTGIFPPLYILFQLNIYNSADLFPIFVPQWIGVFIFVKKA